MYCLGSGAGVGVSLLKGCGEFRILGFRVIKGLRAYLDPKPKNFRA